MDIDKYFKWISEKLDQMTDEEFEQLMIECRIEQCPYEDDELKSKKQ